MPTDVAPSDRPPFWGHAGAVAALAVTPDGRQIITGGDDGAVRLWDRESGAVQGVLTGHTGQVLAVAVTPDGQQIITGGGDGVVRLWDRESGAEQGVLTGHTDRVFAVVVTPDGRQIVTGGDDGLVRVWDRASGVPADVLIGHTGPVFAVAVTPDGRQIVTGGDDGVVGVWDRARAVREAVLIGHTGPVFAVAVTPDGRQIVTGGNDGEVRVWDRRSGAQLFLTPRGQGPVDAVVVTPDGDQIVAGYVGEVRIFDRNSGAEQLVLAGHRRQVHAVVVTPDGRQIVASGRDGSVRVWDRVSGVEEAVLTGHTGPIFAVVVTPDGRQIITGGDDGAVRVWDRESGVEQLALTGHHRQVLAVTMSLDGEEIVTGSGDRQVRVWNRGSGAEQRVFAGHADRVLAVVMTPDGQQIITGGDDGWVRVWDRESGDEQQHLRTGGMERVLAVAVTPDGQQIVTGGGDGVVRLWDRESGAQQRVLIGHTGPVFAVAVTPDGQQIVTGGDDGVVRLWDRESGAQLPALAGHTDRVLAVAVTPDGRQIVTGGGDGVVRLWDRASGVREAALIGHTGPVFAVAVTPDGLEIVSVGGRTIRVWNRRSGMQVRGTATGAPSRRGVLAGVRSDEPSDVDLLDVSDDVDTLAALIAASSTEPPLAVAVLGEWGAGKSTVLRQVHARVERLAGLSLNNLGRSAYVTSIRQITFNAWHYSDDHVWTGLVEHLFRELAGTQPTAPAPAPEATRQKQSQLRQTAEQLEASRDRLDAQLREIDTAPALAGRLAAAGSLGGFARAALSAVGGVAGDLRRGYRILTGWAVLLAGAGALWLWLGPWSRSAAVPVAGVIALAPFAVLGRVHSWMVRFTADQRRRLAEQAGQVRRDLADARAHLAQIDAAANLADVLDRLTTGRAYEGYRGLVGQISSDLDLLEQALTAARVEWQTSGSTARPPLERIVLYVDDLDRCSPDRVVDVLTAIHLLLARRLFIVLVAVDAAWLRRSLTAHHATLFGPTVDGDPASAVVVTPIDWLDKIFQIPFALRPTRHTAADYLTALLPGLVDPSHPLTPIRAPAPRPVAPRRADPQRSSPSTRTTMPVNSPPATPSMDRAVADPDVDRGRGIPDLRPASLTLNDNERALIPLVGPLLPTPRAGKKLINLYRLVRIGVPDSDLATFTAGPYQAVVLLLAIIIGQPVLARPLLTALAASTGDGDIIDFLHDKPCGDALQPACDTIARTIDAIRQAGTSYHGTLATYRQWAPRIARHSFHTVDLQHPGP
ncbi:P-loop NTPase fold protein [Pseudofrankia sp. BMG5.37]|uniref:P-loop NTPase fold protein n=1 Tax=Pseudofrankia sp. BMG5.37 TaxID=3050035 RepID=UPI002894F47B|nr:P-loop NTPase fold protein [Pseudofrankia sp. BMG5.37]MDT3438727.1 P-loop NTPase fold protein [Pseudofrankia sp. BMG5.37]